MSAAPRSGPDILAQAARDADIAVGHCQVRWILRGRDGPLAADP